MSAKVEIPDNEMNEFGLPRVCVVTGSTENVSFQKVNFQWYPQWLAVFACVPLLMAILITVLMRRTKGELPFSESAWAAYKKGKLLLTLSILGALGLFFVGIFAFSIKGIGGALGGACILAAISTPIAVGIIFVKGKGPKCTRIDKGLTHLTLPSAEAAEKIRQHLSAGARAAAPAAS